MKYPNLELIEQTFKEKVKEKYPSVFDTSSQWHKCTADVFVQTWSNTSTGFDLKHVCSGQAFTDEYTAVMRLEWHELSNGALCPKQIYGVFFGNKLAYILKDPNPKFDLDLKNRCMKSQKNARAYINDEFREYRELSF